MTKQRPCDACGGTGERDVALCYCGGLADTCDGCPDCLGLGCYRERERNGSHDCPACSGRGWQSDAMPVAESWWAVDARDMVAQRVTADADTPPSEGGRFWKIAASSAAEAIDRALARRALCAR